MTGQIYLDSYADAGVVAALELVNALQIGYARGRQVPEDDDPLPAIAGALSVDPPSVEALTERHVPAFLELSRQLDQVLTALHQGDTDAAAVCLNDLLAAHPAYPHLARERGTWRLHHHPADAELVSMWTSICAEALARIIGRGDQARLGVCAAPQCERVYYDTSKNGSRRFCSSTCQNRVKTAAFRRRGAAGDGA